LNNYIYIKKGFDFERINLSEIIYLKTDDKKVSIVMEKRTINTSNSLYYLAKVLNKDFFRSHKSYIININKVKKIIKFSDKVYNVEFYGTDDKAFLSYKNLVLLKKQSTII
jgi:two-component system LytT family response regulator